MTTKKQPEADQNKPSSILINFVLDRSGSMESIRRATISGFNEFKNDQASEEGEAVFTLTLFDTRFDTVCRATPVAQVPDLTPESYQPNGMTALYDAIGHTMHLTDEYVALHRPDQVLFVIMTDGEENSSREFDRDRIFAMIRERQELAHYEFIYLGANQDSYIAGQQMGLRDGRMIDYAATDEGSRDVLLRASANVKAHRRHRMPMSEEFFSPEMEALGNIDPAAWKRMNEEQKRAEIVKGTSKRA